MIIHKCDVCKEENDQYIDIGFKSLSHTSISSFGLEFQHSIEVCHDCVRMMGFDPNKIQNIKDIVHFIISIMKLATLQDKLMFKDEE